MRGPRLAHWVAWLCLLTAANPASAEPTRMLKVVSDRPDAEFYLIRSRVLDDLAPMPAQRPLKVLNGGFLRHPIDDRPVVLVDAIYYVFMFCGGTLLKPSYGLRISGRVDPPPIPCR